MTTVWVPGCPHCTITARPNGAVATYHAFTGPSVGAGSSVVLPTGWMNMGVPPLRR